MARTGLRMMPTSPSPPLKFRTAGFPQYGFKASVSDRASLQVRSLKPAPGIRSLPRSLLLPFARFHHNGSPGSVSKTVVASTCRCAGGFFLPTPGGLGSRPSCAVSVHLRLLLPHAPVSQARCDFTFTLIRSAFAVREHLGDPRNLPYFRCRAFHTCRRPYPGGPPCPPVALPR